jgi:hypothetical protein
MGFVMGIDSALNNLTPPRLAAARADKHPNSAAGGLNFLNN